MEGIKGRLNDSIQLQLSFVLSVVVAVVAIAAGTFSFLSALNEAHERQDDVLYQVSDLMGRIQVSAPQAMHEIELQDADHDSSLFVRILGPGTAIKKGLLDDAIPLPSPLADGLHTLDLKDKTFRVLVRTISGGEHIVIAQDTDIRNAAAFEGALRALTPFLILVPILLIVIAELIRRLFRPTRILSERVDARVETDLRPIVSHHLPREIRPFVHAINRLLTRVSESMEAQRRFVDDAAHELRSPTAALSLQAERLGRAEMSDAARERLWALRRGIDRNQHLLTQLLALAKAQTSAGSHDGSATHIQDVFHNVLETVLPLAEARHIDIGVTGRDDPAVPASELDLTTLVRNLVDNAIRYTPEGGRVDLSAKAEPDATVLSVSDTGSGIPVTERERIFEPFYRVLGSGQTGSGLGLSIVAAIARKLDARIEISDAGGAAQSGLRVAVTIPLKTRQDDQFGSPNQ